MRAVIADDKNCAVNGRQLIGRHMRLWSANKWVRRSSNRVKMVLSARFVEEVCIYKVIIQFYYIDDYT